MNDDSDLAAAILDKIATDDSVEQAQFWWKSLAQDNIGGSAAARWKIILHAAAFAAIEAAGPGMNSENQAKLLDTLTIDRPLAGRDAGAARHCIEDRLADISEGMPDEEDDAD